ncbi:putative transcription factor C2H2 family [Helianthus annuus]|nr:putative transcription factor C2H2 family [Helianthus annuus]KAJ0633241.1 putative transcription factor C2H2 family [Helianthus annuus]KAJ0814125.1 putative transcription factor C2H2 family [Helianthus annuus]KAJ0827310.1 putative transcription factor C2H2 family [Helianthus annuus]
MSQDHQPRYRKPKTHPDPIQPTRPKSTISSILSTFSPTTEDPPTPDNTNTKKKLFTATRFRGLGCTAPAQVSVPAMIRTSANWEGKKVRKKKMKKNKNSASASDDIGGLEISASGNNNSNNNNPVMVGSSSSSSSCLVGPDVWCGPGIGLSTDAANVDCVVSRRPVVVSARGKVDIDKVNVRERVSYGGRRMVHPEDLPFFDTDSGIPHHRLDVFGSRHHRHLRHRSPEGLAEIVMLQGNLLMGGRLDHDRYRDWRLDVDSMSYEELLELGDKIGYVSTGLRDDEIRRCVRKTKPPMNKSSSHISTEIQWKCTICQEEHEEEDEIGKLECGHLYHMYCIKQWLGQKKTCPICKTAVESQQ